MLLRPRTAHDTLLGWIYKRGLSDPNAFGHAAALTTSAEGFRIARSAIADADAGQVRLICSGDGLTVGVGVADTSTWCAQLDRPFPRLQTINLGQDAYGVDQSVLLYQRQGQLIPHTLHVLAVTNDALERMTADNSQGWFKPYLALEAGRLVPKNVPVPLQTARGLTRAHRAGMVEELRLVQLIRRIPVFDKRRSMAARVDAHWTLLEKMLETVVVEDRSRGSQFLLAYLRTHSTQVFVYYRWALAALIIVVALVR